MPLTWGAPWVAAAGPALRHRAVGLSGLAVQAQSVARRLRGAADGHDRHAGRRLAAQLDDATLLILIFVPALFVILFYTIGCCRPSQIVPS